VDEIADGGGLEVEFAPTEGHRELLWLLERHVLSVVKYGQFAGNAYDPSRRLLNRRRGAAGIDPVFCAQVCLRAWIWLSSSSSSSGGGEGGSTNSSSSGRWLSNYLERRLTTNDAGGGNPSPTATSCPPKRRLACRALARALLWNDDDEEEYEEYDKLPLPAPGTATSQPQPHPQTQPQTQTQPQRRGKRPMVLAESLGLDAGFVVFLARASCGLVECVPSPIVDRIMESDGGTAVAASTASLLF